MERSRHASHLASRSYRGGIPDLGGGDEVAGAGAGGVGVGVGAAFSGASAMTRGEGADAIRGRQRQTQRRCGAETAAAFFFFFENSGGVGWGLLSLREFRALEPFESGAKAWPSGPGHRKRPVLAIQALAQPAFVTPGTHIELRVQIN